MKHKVILSEKDLWKNTLTTQVVFETDDEVLAYKTALERQHTLSGNPGCPYHFWYSVESE